MAGDVLVVDYRCDVVVNKVPVQTVGVNRDGEEREEEEVEGRLSQERGQHYQHEVRFST